MLAMRSRLVLLLLAVLLYDGTVSSANSPALVCKMRILNEDQARTLLMSDEASDWLMSPSEQSKNTAEYARYYADYKTIRQYPEVYSVIEVVFKNTDTKPLTINRSQYLNIYQHALSSVENLTKKYPNFNANKWLLRSLSLLIPSIGFILSKIIFDNIEYNNRSCFKERVFVIAPSLFTLLLAGAMWKYSLEAAKLERKLDKLRALSGYITTADETYKIDSAAEQVEIPAGGTFTDTLIINSTRMALKNMIPQGFASE